MQATGAPAFTAPASGAPAFAPQPETTGSTEPVSAAPASTPPLSSPFATYTAPTASQPVSAPPVTPPVSAPPAGTTTGNKADSAAESDGGVTPPGGFASAGWPGGSSTHPTSGAATGEVVAQQPAADTSDGAASPFGKTGAFPAEPETQAAPVSIAKADADPAATAAYTPVPAAEGQPSTETQRRAHPAVDG